MPSRINLLTVASIGIFAFGLEPIVHEVLGHAIVCWLTGGKVILISSTAMQTASASRFVPAAGPLANILFGLAALALLRSLTSQRANSSALTAVGAHATADTPAASRVARSSLTRLFLFLYFFSFANLFLAFGYILYSGLINFGDFAAVIVGLHPAWLYRATLVIAGALGYRYGIAQAARCLALLIAPPFASTNAAAQTQPPPLPAVPPTPTPQSQAPPPPASPLSLPAARRITRTACFAGSALFLLASFLNPISPSLILYDGLPGAIGLTLGFFLALTDLRQFAARQTPVPQPTPEIGFPFNAPLTISAAIFASAFLLYMGRGISLR
jgi:hypothetical protein